MFALHQLFHCQKWFDMAYKVTVLLVNLRSISLPYILYWKCVSVDSIGESAVDFTNDRLHTWCRRLSLQIGIDLQRQVLPDLVWGLGMFASCLDHILTLRSHKGPCRVTGLPAESVNLYITLNSISANRGKWQAYRVCASRADIR